MVTTQQAGLREQFCIALNRLIQMARIHQDNNLILVEAVNGFAGLIEAVAEEDDAVTLQIMHGRLYLQNEKLAYQRKSAGLLQNVQQYFLARGLEGVRFSSRPGPAAAAGNRLVAFTRLLDSSVQHGDPPGWLAQQIEREGIAGIEVVLQAAVPPEETPAETEPGRRERLRRQRARRTYACALNSIRDVAERITQKRPVGARKTIRIVQNMVDLVMADEPVLMGLSTIRDYDDYTFSHSVNVAILSMCLGRRIGLSRTTLERLGLSGLFHDLGKIDVPREILQKPGRLTAQEMEEVRKHPLNSVRQIIQLNISRELKTHIIIPPFEHHRRYDLSGYPAAPRKKPMSFLGQIIAIVDAFDAMTTPRAYQPEPYSPDRALVLMLHGAGRYFDPVLLKVFISMLGLYPVGTLLELDSGELGLVMEAPEVADGLPRLLLLEPDGQGGFRKGAVIDLAGDESRTGSRRCSIRNSYHPSVFGIQPAQFFV